METVAHPDNAFQPLLFAPSELLAVGLADAHTQAAGVAWQAGRWLDALLAHVAGSGMGVSACWNGAARPHPRRR